MSRYRLEYEPKASKQLRAIKDRRLLVAMERAIAALADDPRPQGCLKLVGYKDHWRVRVGDWRIVYRIEDEEQSGPGPIRGSSGAPEAPNARRARLVLLVIRVAPRGRCIGRAGKVRNECALYALCAAV